MFSFNMSANNTNAKLARVISPVAYGGTPWSRRALATGNGVGAVQVSSPSGVSKLNLPITNIIECNDKLVRIMADAIHSTQELKSLHASAYARERGICDCYGARLCWTLQLTPHSKSSLSSLTFRREKGLALSSHLFDH